MENFTTKDIADILGCECPVDCNVLDISTDTRAISQGSVFVALKGANFDGHNFAKNAARAGACAVVSQLEIEDIPCLVTDDTTKALGDIARGYRNKFSPILVGITGSVGKTTTKDMVALVLSEKYKTLKTQGNLNNHIGLPKTLFGLDSTYEAAVIEMGMNHFGEIDYLTNIAKPNIAVITNIGWSHIENLGSREGILKAKLEILNSMQDDMPLVINADDEMLFSQKSQLERNIITYGIDNQNADIKAIDINPGDSKTEFSIICGDEKCDITLNATGTHNVLNALCAFAVGKNCGLENEQIQSALSKFKPNAMRQNVIKANSISIIADCYNASPDSMKAALEMLNLQSGKRRIAVLGDMLELGEYSKALHSAVGEYCAKSSADMVFCVGAQSKYIARSASLKGKAAKHFFNPETLIQTLKETVCEGDVILFKASRGMHLENVIKSLFGDIIS
ncbi:MAG: UDP-N-acetylmuramoyl-tripeptide--D-alanyl-D-alanine ligase [Oscillospiraceae bacterium]|nr:UDP-N-acetylmuramoyl-tripeptide--D-alanyl-D-alanine ligase [Oscillospiraceae bacterium]